MTPEEADLTGRAAALVAATLRRDQPAVERIIGGFGSEISRLADACVLLLLVEASTLAMAIDVTLEAALRTFQPARPPLLPGVASAPPDPIVRLALAVSAGDVDGIRSVPAALDVPTMINTAFGLTLGAIHHLSEVLRRPPQQLLDAWIVYAAFEETGGTSAPI